MLIELLSLIWLEYDLSLLGNKGKNKGWGTFGLTEKQKFPGVPLHVLHKNGTEVQLLGIRAKGADKGYGIQVLKSFSGTVLVYDCCPRTIISTTLFNFPSVPWFR